MCVKREGAVPPQDRKAKQEKEREQRIAEGEAEVLGAGNPRLQEQEELQSCLVPQGLTIKDIPSDGNW